MAIRLQAPGPFLVHGNGTPLTRMKFVTEVRAAVTGDGMDLSCYTEHSFRIAATSSDAQAGIPSWFIDPNPWLLEVLCVTMVD